MKTGRILQIQAWCIALALAAAIVCAASAWSIRALVAQPGETERLIEVVSQLVGDVAHLQEWCGG